jgi:hypothetical protein
VTRVNRFPLSEAAPSAAGETGVGLGVAVRAEGVDEVEEVAALGEVEGVAAVDNPLWVVTSRTAARAPPVHAGTRGLVTRTPFEVGGVEGDAAVNEGTRVTVPKR